MCEIYQIRKISYFLSMKHWLIFAAVLSLLTIPVLGQNYPPEVLLPGLKDKVTVRRDARWIPYIEAKSDADLYFAQGYVTASDRLWEMDLLRRVVRGETAEIFGRQTLEEDKRWRRYGFVQIADATVRNYAPEMRTILDEYARGVNAYIVSLTDESTPIEFKLLQYKPREWSPTDTVMIGKLLAEALSSTYQRDLLRKSIQGVDPQKLADLTNPVTPYDVVLFGKDLSTARNENIDINPASMDSVLSAADNDIAIRARSLGRVGLYAEELAASNNWVISGKRTADGKPLLANDPHLTPSAPGIWYMAHLSSPNLRAAGVTFPGTPGIVLGHNENIAWGATNVGPDVQDLYVETFDGERYKTADGWADAEVRTEKVGVRANPLSPTVTYETFETTSTRNGPVIFEADGKRYSLKWTALDPKNNEFEAFFRLNRAKDWNDFKNALRTYGGATQNFIYADVNGNIGWYAAGRIPIRRTGDGALPYDGASTDGDWVGMIPFEELPNLYDPPEGFIVTANQRIVGTGYKYQQVSRDAAPPWRARRLYDLLKADTKATMDAMTAAQLDAYNIPFSMLAKDIVELNAASAENLELLRAWDGKMTPDSGAALLLNEIRNCASNKMADDNKPVPTALIRERVLHWAVHENAARWLPKGVPDYATLLKACESASGSAFTSRYGTDKTKWVWGSAFDARFNHPLAAIPLIGSQFAAPKAPLSGSGQTPNVGSAVSMRHISSPGNWDATRFVIPLGQSGDPKSEYYKDQFEAWRIGKVMTLPFSKVAVESGQRTFIMLTPKLAH